jgi:hypothetical protein
MPSIMLSSSLLSVGCISDLGAMGKHERTCLPEFKAFTNREHNPSAYRRRFLRLRK